MADRETISPPAPWKYTGGSAVGGLTDVGFAPGSDLLLVCSSQGRGLFDCLTGERIARDRNDDYPFDPVAHFAEGIGEIAGRFIPTSGLHGGSSRVATDDGWTLAIEADSETFRDTVWPFHRVFLVAPDGARTFLVDSRSVELRAATFSPTGRSLAVGISCDVFLFARSGTDAIKDSAPSGPNTLPSCPST